MERKDYNATLVSLDPNGRVVSHTIGYADNGTIYAAAGFWTHSIWTAAYDAEWRGSRFSMVASVQILMDGGEAYKSRLAGLDLPTIYRAA